jgi:hypothetical protein
VQEPISHASEVVELWTEGADRLAPESPGYARQGGRSPFSIGKCVAFSVASSARVSLFRFAVIQIVTSTWMLILIQT